ncbi:MAG: hypothetical protein J7J67_00640 [Thermoproteales archaeon]|nr:hypothetical protein [Thermoproteales archaeon]
MKAWGADNKLRGVNPIIATIFLIVAGVIVGVMYVGWSQNWFAASSRYVDLQVSAELARRSQRALLTIQIKNVGLWTLSLDLR